jgi:hypothetical protein
MILHGATCSENWLSRPPIGRRLNLCLRLNNLLVSLFRGLLLFGAVVIRAVVIRAVVIRPGKPNNPFHLAFQGRFNRFRLAFSSRDAAHVRWVKIELPGDATVEAPKKGCEVEWGCANATFDFCHHSCYSLL